MVDGNVEAGLQVFYSVFEFHVLRACVGDDV